MRTFAVVSAALAMTTAAVAGEFPISDDYGTRDGCKLYVAGGDKAVEYSGPGEDREWQRKQLGVKANAHILVVAHYGVLSPSRLCDLPTEVARPQTVACYRGDGITRFKTVAIVEDTKAARLTYIENGKAIALHRCEN